jgi:hypothetical protein
LLNIWAQPAQQKIKQQMTSWNNLQADCDIVFLRTADGQIGRAGSLDKTMAANNRGGAGSRTIADSDRAAGGSEFAGQTRQQQLQHQSAPFFFRVGSFQRQVRFDYPVENL